ncbi:SA1362 family protein [Aquibacillus albus]|uniref:Uncharacterized membrane protein (DUF106 family) n=1 Tax=Aquibacillus albus TaxID=1168171 RepID=A0ABS2MUX6_9BACI|nr:SA1362 family protein [Aquibacillus albus]MBM7569691.1 uncharacterized membrane protein (DUF106 family) [Aquibacillus albus]
MFRRKLTPLIYLLIGLAVIGFIGQLVTDTASLITNLLIMIAIGAIIYGIIYYFVISKRSPNDLKKYKKAVKQSKMKYKKGHKGNKSFSQLATKQTPLLNKKRSTKSRPTHLRVIEGNKPKRKNRASF